MRVRHLSLILLVRILFLPDLIFAQTISYERHKPLCCDTLWAYKLPYIQVTDSGRECEWDFTEFSTDTAEIIDVNYFALSPIDTTRIGLHRERINYYYQIIDDTLCLTGYENSRTQVRFINPVRQISFPFSYNDTFNDTVIGKGDYCHIMPISVNGTYFVKADAMGKLRLPDMEIDTALRVHTKMEYRDSRHKDNLIQDERYSWYSPYCRYPLFETNSVRAITKVDTIFISASYYYLQEQEDIPSREEIQPNIEPEYVDSLITNVTFLPNPVRDNLNIQYLLSRPANVYISLHYNGGISTYKTPIHQEDDGTHTVSINMGGMPVGNYVVYIHADNVIVSGNIIKL